MTMKKKLTLLFTIIFSVFNFAGTKEDLETSFNKYAQHKNIDILEGDLKDIASKKSDEYTNIAKSNLANIALSKNNIVDGVKYLNEIANAKEASKELRINSLLTLYGFANGPLERIKLSERILTVDPEANLYHAGMVADYTSLKDEKANVEYKKLIAGVAKEDVETVEFALAQEFLIRGLVSEAITKLETLTKSNNKLTKANAYYILATLENNINNALKNALEAKKNLTNDNYSLERLLSNIYEEKNNYKQALEHSKNMLKIAKNPESFSYVIFFAELINDNKTVSNTIKEMKDTFKGQENRVNLELAHSIFSYGNFELSKKYAKEALEKDKQDEAIIPLLNIAISNKNKKEALEYLNIAKKANFENLDEVEKIINNIK